MRGWSLINTIPANANRPTIDDIDSTQPQAMSSMSDTDRPSSCPSRHIIMKSHRCRQVPPEMRLPPGRLTAQTRRFVLTSVIFLIVILTPGRHHSPSRSNTLVVDASTLIHVHEIPQQSANMTDAAKNNTHHSSGSDLNLQHDPVVYGDHSCGIAGCHSYGQSDDAHFNQAENLDQQANTNHHHEEPLPLISGDELNSSQDSSQQQAARQNKGKRTLYACEEKQLEIECQLGESIQLIRANYGRFSIQICNEHGQLDWKVNCMSPDSFKTIAESCQSKQSCQLLASNEIFGDACPGTQKYLEVHYQCVPANRTQASLEQLQQPPRVNQQSGLKQGTIKTGNDVIQQLNAAPTTTATTTTTTTTTTSSLAASPSEMQARPQNWPGQVGGASPSSPSWPNWLPPLTSAGSSLFEAPATPILRPPPPGQCPEQVSRGMRWPETPAGLLAYTSCPSHAQPSDSTVRPAAAVALYCKPDGQWASRVQMLGRCQSLWLRNLANRLETGDSPLSILTELVHRTSAGTILATTSGATTTTTTTAASSGHQPAANWLAYATSSLGESMSKLPVGQTNAPLFGEDLVQMSRVVGKLVEEFGELLARISDDKQRITFARDMIQLIVDLTSNLMDQHHADAWLDLGSVSSSGVPLTGDRQRVAGQLLGALESGSVLLANALQQLAWPPGDQPDPSQLQPEDFQKLTEHVYVAIQSIGLDRNKASQRLQVTFPSQTSLMGARWINSDQRFTLNLQVSSEQLDLAQAGKAVGGQRQLKIVSVMLRGLGAYMEPGVLQQQQQQQQQQLVQDSGDKSKIQGLAEAIGKRLAVNSDLVGLSMVADPAVAQGGASAVRVDLAAPVELVFRHLHGGGQQPPTSRPPVCVLWDGSTSDWSTSGCTLAASNRTHSVCACNHLTTFGLLSELDQRQMMPPPTSALASDGRQQQPTSGPLLNQQQQPRPIRVHLDRVEDELPLGGSEQPIYMARLLDGDLFSGQTSARTLIFVSCCLSGLLLALLLAAAAYNKAHARRLLGSLPAEAPPSLLVANYHNQRHYQAELHAANSIETSTTTPNGTSPPTSYSSSGANHHLSQQQHQNGVGDLLTSNKHQEHGNELNGFYSLTFSHQDHSNYYGINSQSRQQPQQQFKPRLPARLQSNDGQRYLAANSAISQLALVPCHLIVQQLLLQLLLLLLIESQNLLAWSSQQSREMLVRDNLLLMDFGNSPQPRADNQLDPLNWLTWSAVFALYYLASTLVCWLLTRLVQLSGHLFKLNGGLHQTAARPYQTIRTISSNALYQQPINRYGQCQIHHNASSSSPSLSSNFASVLPESATTSHLAKESTMAASPSLALAASPLAARLATSKQLARLLTHVLPLLSSGLLLWFSLERGHSINLVAFTLSWSSQLVYWPLALEAGWPIPLAVYLYCLPGICLALGVVVLLMLRRHLSQFYLAAAASQVVGPAHTATTAGGPSSLFKPSAGYQPEGDPDKTAHFQTRRRPAAAALELSLDSRRAKLTCLTLLALLALSSICWISFFTHCHQVLSQATRNTNTAAYSNHLIVTFASSNLLISLLICCSQRKQVKRASQLMGLSRLFSLLAGYCCCCCRHLVEANQASPSSSSVSSSTYYNNQGQSGGLQQPPQHYGTALNGKPIPKAGVSQQSLFGLSRSRPDLATSQPAYNPQAYGALQQQMLADQQHLYQQLAAASSQQHIYDSATNLNELADHHQKQRQWNALQIMAQQQQQQQQQQHQQFNQQREPMIHYTLGGRPFNEQQQFHLSQQQQQQHFFHQPVANMTLKPSLPASGGLQMSQGARNKPHESFMCPISAGLDSVNTSAKTNPAASSSSGRQPQQQQQQQLSGSSSCGSSSGSGEADGPLVALSQSSTPMVNRRPSNQSAAATFGPMHHHQHNHMLSHNNNSNNNNNQQQLQRAIEHRPSSESRGAHDSIDQHGDNQSCGQVIGRAVAGQDGRSISGHHQNTAHTEARGGQEANQQHHFRRANSNANGKPHGSFASNVMMDVQFDYSSQRAPDRQHQADEMANNIYDVANCGQVAGC